MFAWKHPQMRRRARLLTSKHKRQWQIAAVLAATFTVLYFTNLRRSAWRPNLNEVLPYLRAHAATIASDEHLTRVCERTPFGDGWGAHTLCNIKPTYPCTFFSFGISTDYTFDSDLATKWGCRGFAADPTIVHPSQLHPMVTFHNVAAKMLHSTGAPRWWSTSVPALKKFLNVTHLSVLKMDCEGCEYSLAKDVLLEDPKFFHNVGQFAVEIHVTKVWLNDDETLYAFGKLLKILDEAGLKLQDAKITSCANVDEAAGCMDLVKEIGLPCGNANSCHNFLFARY